MPTFLVTSFYFPIFLVLYVLGILVVNAVLCVQVCSAVNDGDYCQ